MSRPPVIRTSLACCVAAALGLPVSALLADDGRSNNRIEARLKSYEEVPTLSSPASGRFKALIDKASSSISYELSYRGLEGTVTMAHLHFGSRGTTGGIMVWLCQTGTNPDPAGASGSPTCPALGSVSGVIQMPNVVGPAAQGVAAGEFAELLAGIRAGAVYVNVHSTRFPSGEIRGQLRDDD